MGSEAGDDRDLWIAALELIDSPRVYVSDAKRAKLSAQPCTGNHGADAGTKYRVSMCGREPVLQLLARFHSGHIASNHPAPRGHACGWLFLMPRQTPTPLRPGTAADLHACMP